MRTVAVDMDGTISAWTESGHSAGEWMDGARDALVDLLREGIAVVVHSCRVTWEAGGGLASVMEFLSSGGFEPVPVVGMGEGIVPFGCKRQDELRPMGLVNCTAGCDPTTNVSVDAPVCETCKGVGVLAELGEIGVWVGQGKPVAMAYVDDRAVLLPADGGWAEAMPKVRELLGLVTL